MNELKNRYEYSYSDIIGAGSYGDCYQAYDKLTNKQCAIKINRPTDQVPIDKFVKEAESLETLNHPCIVRGYDHFEHEGQLVIVMDYYENGDVESYTSKSPMDYSFIIKWVAQLCSALNHLHSMNILHRDIKLQNLFLDTNLNLYVGDFGTVRLQEAGKFCQTFIGTPQIMSPELLSEQPYSFQSDMWAVGCILYQLLEGKPPFRSANFVALMKMITEGRYEVPKTTNVFLRDLVLRLLVVDPLRRFTSDQVLDQIKTQNPDLIRQLPTYQKISTTSTKHGEQGQAEQVLIRQFNEMQTFIQHSAFQPDQVEPEQDTQNSSQDLKQFNVQYIKQLVFSKLLNLLSNDSEFVYQLIVAQVYIFSNESEQEILSMLGLQQKTPGNLICQVVQQKYNLSSRKAQSVAKYVRWLAVNQFAEGV